jgi:hypothetical protein
MHQIKNTAILFLLLLLGSCIKSYEPVIDSKASNKYVVSGRVTDQEGWQEVEVSLSSPVDSALYKPVSGCLGIIRDDKGNSFPLQEYQNGHYRTFMKQIDLVPGTSYRVEVLTPDGQKIESGYEKMPLCAPLDSVYYALEEIQTADPGVTNTVMQFYVDLDANGNYSQFYKWEVEETWEYHAAHPLEFYYDGTFHEVKPPDYTNKICWITVLAKNVFTLSTKTVAQGVYKQYPLHYIDGKSSSRLGILYSILVKQYAMSEAAYNYWEQLRINSNEQGGLYEKQPNAIKGNLQNTDKPDNEVLGYFFAASVKSRRYFYQQVEGIDLSFYNYCTEDGLGKFGWKEFFTWEYPIFYYYNEIGLLRILNAECIDCRRLGGTLDKPDFWPY